MKHIFLLFFMLTGVIGYSQDTTYVYFESGAYTLNDDEADRLESQIIQRKSQTLDSILLYGHADNKGSLDYNKRLAKQRVESIEKVIDNEFDCTTASSSQSNFNESNISGLKSDRYVRIIWYTKTKKEEVKDAITLEQSRTNITSMLQSFAPPKIKVALDQSQNKVMLTDAGNLLLIQKETFVRKDGSVPEKVNLSIQEFTSMSSFLSEGYRTMTTDGELLETGGMMNLEATDENGDPLQMAKSMTLGFARGETDKPGMQLFNGVVEKGEVLWNMADQPGYKKPFKINWEKIFMAGLDHIASKGAVANSAVNVTKVVYKSSNKFKNIKDLKGEDKKMIKEAIKTEGIYHVQTQANNYREKVRQEQAQRRQQSAEAVQESNYYFMNTTQMGRINCDDLQMYTGKRVCMKVKRIVEKNAYEGLYLVFRDINSYMVATRFDGCDFGNVPEGADVILIGIKGVGDQSYFASKKIKISGKTQSLVYQKCSNEECKRKLNRLMNLGR